MVSIHSSHAVTEDAYRGGFTTKLVILVLKYKYSSTQFIKYKHVLKSDLVVTEHQQITLAWLCLLKEIQF